MIQSVQRALKLLNTVAAANDWIGVRELARQTGLKVTTAQQLLKTLQHCGYLDFDPSRGGYRIGLAASLLSEKHDRLEQLGHFFRPTMMELQHEFNESFALLALLNHQVVVVDWIVSSHQLNLSVPRGKVIEHPHHMATGRVLLAYQEPAFIEAYLRHHIECPQEQERLRRELDKIREQGAAEVENIENSAVAAVAVPVHNRRGQILAAMGCYAPVSRFPRAKRDAVLKTMQTRISTLAELLP